jgi:N,N'-diacetyllegionaminate synthase
MTAAAPPLTVPVFPPPDGSVFVIAEAGVNHNGDPGLAREMIAAAAAAGADAVKFQAFTADNLTRRSAATAPYQRENAGVANQHDLLRGLELSLSVFAELAEACRSAGVTFLCTPFLEDMAEPLTAMGMPWIKVASSELTNTPALRRFGKLGRPVLLSTGMADENEVATALDVLDAAGAPAVMLLHCASIYPAPPEAANLRALTTLARRFGRPIGYSDHTQGDEIAVAAVALGARVIEKHFTLDRRLPGPDHAASLEPAELAAMIRRLRNAAAALGDGVKRPTAEETEVARLVRRSWHAARDLAAGTVLRPGDATLKRPADGLSPAEEPWGRRLTTACGEDQPIHAEDLAPPAVKGEPEP